MTGRFEAIRRFVLAHPEGVLSRDVRAMLGPDAAGMLHPQYKRGNFTRTGTEGSYRYHAVPERCAE